MIDSDKEWDEIQINGKPIEEMVIPDFSKYPALKEHLFGKKDKFILDKDKNVIPASLFEWGQFFENNEEERIVKKDKINGLKISTVFIGVDHNICRLYDKEEDHELHIFETMVFDGNMSDIYCDRYATWKEAEEGHQSAIEWVKSGCKDEA